MKTLPCMINNKIYIPIISNYLTLINNKQKQTKNEINKLEKNIKKQNK